jgi:hypothetical protein
MPLSYVALSSFDLMQRTKWRLVASSVDVRLLSCALNVPAVVGARPFFFRFRRSSFDADDDPVSLIAPSAG